MLQILAIPQVEQTVGGEVADFEGFSVYDNMILGVCETLGRNVVINPALFCFLSGL
jgi:hypothetical protein